MQSLHYNILYDIKLKTMAEKTAHKTHTSETKMDILKGTNGRT
jgi:hypothetical protein